ncbi:multiple epidermal growth factor-like domains protein 10 [Patella vulgata]|uniref:multiple epidermal growth factor-like domains protein 10 n=1 Tax=Patella vulgata TaxID=6465 RepID=UPI00217F3D5B|nr:multiple epidermal growth factor-like domains protein 10 [Patella vulgata]XP_050400828.1 multiple epidermal growth factor-like domains protein 10 [Patella vulgata]
MPMITFSVVTIISSLIINILALNVCRDISTNCQSCGTTEYRQNCMKTCNVCMVPNVALGKPTNQSSTYFHVGLKFSSVASLAVDGNTSSVFETMSCSHTVEDVSGWWCVDLQQIYDVERIKIFNRDLHQYRLQGFEIKLLSDDQCNEQGFRSATSCYRNTPPTVQDVYTIDGCNQQPSRSLSARTVFIKATDTLTLCEVEIYAGGYCNTGYYSTSNTTCEPCNACSNKACNRDNGVCANGCINGYYGSNCPTPCPANCDGTCDRTTGACKTCKPGFYGNLCESVCSSNCNGGCDKSDGKCNDCKPNTVGTYCNSPCGTECLQDTNQKNKTISCDREGRCTDCILGRYGDGCDKICSSACVGGCKRGTGLCDRCIKGKGGDTCDKDCKENCTVCNQEDINNCTECKYGRWGTSCNKQCSSNCKDGLCHQISGHCINGCLPGKMGTTCTSDCRNGFYGENCEIKCGNCANNISCDISSGSCGLVGCIEGYTGPNCHVIISDGATINPVLIGFIGFLCGIPVMIIICIVHHFYTKRRQSTQSTDVVNGKDLNPTRAIPDATTHVEYKNQSYLGEENRNMYDTIDHTVDSKPNTYTTLYSNI